MFTFITIIVISKMSLKYLLFPIAFDTSMV